MKKIILGVAVMAGALLLNSCNSYLDKIPDNRTELDSKEKIAELLVNAYPSANYIPFCEVMSDNVGDKGSAARVTNTANTESFFWKDSSTDNTDTPDDYWDACYEAIAHANMALDAIDKLPSKVDATAQRGEALVCRAYSHFMLATMFSKTFDVATASSDLGIPYVTKVETVVRKDYQRGTVAQDYELIERDLLEGLALISDDGYKIPKYHFTKVAAYAFATRFFLFKKDYASVVKYADKVLGADISRNLRDWKTYKSMSYYELKKAYTLSSERSVLLLHETFSRWGRYCQSYRYSLAQVKFAQFFNSATVTGGKWLYPIYGGETSYGIPKFEEYFKKVSVDATTGWPINMVPLFTCEEVFFNKMEAKVMLESPSAEIISDLNVYISTRVDGYTAANDLTADKIFAFYKLPTAKENLIACILSLKQVDFMHEGMRWLDILRNGIVVVHKTYDGEILTLSANDPRRILQIPLKARNNGIPANPR